MTVDAEINALMEQILLTGTGLAAAGLVTGSWGNISAWLTGKDKFLITPSGIPYEELTEKDLVLVSKEGTVVWGHRKPSTELLLHKAIYDSCPDVRAVVHSHSIYASSFAVAGKPLPPILEDQVQLVGREIPVAKYARAGTAALADCTAKVLRESGVQAVLLANHGLVAVGETVAQAYQVCQIVEKTAQIYIMASLIGTPNLIPDEDLAALRDSFRKDYGQ